MSIACLQAEIDTGESSCYIQKSRISKYTSAAVPSYMGAYFCMGAYKCNVVVVIKMGAYIHGMLIMCGCLFPFYGIWRAVALTEQLAV